MQMEDTHRERMNVEEQIVSKLTEKDKRTVQKFHRQLSTHSVLSVKSEDVLTSDDEDDDEITEEEALRLQRVIQAFQYHKKIQELPSEDTTDGKYKKLSSNSMDLLFSSITSESRYISPGRFHVFLSEESKAIVREVNHMIQNTFRRTTSKEVLVVQTEELGSSYQGLNHGSHSNAKHFHIQPDDITVNFNDKNGCQSKKNVFHHMNANGYAIHLENRQANGHANWYSVPLSKLPPKERFRCVVRKVIHSERRRKETEHEQKRKDYLAKFWKRRGDVSWFGLFLTLIGPCAFIADTATDLKVASDHISSGNPWWGTFTIMLVVFPAILVNVASYFYYKEDEDQAQRQPESGWQTVKITHFFQIGLLERWVENIPKKMFIMLKE